MSESEIILRWVAVVILASYLCLRQWQRIRSRPKPQKRPLLPGKAFDSSPLLIRVQRVRQHYTGTFRSSSRATHLQKSLVPIAHKVIGALPYFRDRQGEHETLTDVT